MGAQISNTNWKIIEAIQHIGMRTITGLPWYVRNFTLLNSMNIPTRKYEIKEATDCQLHTPKINLPN